MAKARVQARRIAESVSNHRFTDDFREGASKVQEGVRDMAVTAGEAAKAQVDPIGEYVRENPMQSVLLAAGVGALFGMLFLRR